MGAYFSAFNLIQYPNFDGSSNFLYLKDITTRVINKLNVIDDTSLFYYYTMSESESPESLAETLYGSAYYSWVFLLINNLYDRFYDFPLSTSQFTDYIVNKYGSLSAAQNQFNYYITDPYAGSIQVNQETYENSSLPKYTLTLYDWELSLNESKRTIRVLSPQYISQFVKQFNSLVNS